MPMTLAVGQRWGVLLDHVADAVRGLGLGPFEACRVIVATRETGRVVSQQLASRLGISAGVRYVTPQDLLRELAVRADVSDELGRWKGSPLDLAVQATIPEVAKQFPLLDAALAPEDDRPGWRRSTAVRLARLIRTYHDLAPELVASWLDGGESDALGAELAPVAAWQPELVRTALGRLEIDPSDILHAVRGAAAEDDTPTMLLAVDDVTVPELGVLTALSEGRELKLVQRAGSRGASWASPLAESTVALPGEPAQMPAVEVHDSHGEARQVEVLREELTRAFAADPTLEPRQVAIVCPQPERFAPLLDAAFAPGDPGTHPGRRLRVQPIGLGQPNPLLHLLVDLLRLDGSRASASGLTELLLRPAIAHRWGLQDRAEIVELVSGAGVHWGLDAAHREQFGLGDVTQNTWVRGLDRLLVGLAVGFDDDAGLGLSGAEVVTASDMSTVGALCEVVSRLRRLVARTADPATVPVWTARCRDALDTLVALPRDDEWQLSSAARTLSRLESDHAGDDTLVTRHEFGLLLADAANASWRRPAAGNGSLLVLPLGELPHVEFRLVAMLGVTDDAVPGRTGLPADCVPLGDQVEDPRIRRRERLLDHALSAERVLIVRQARSPRTNDRTAPPVAVSWLLEHLGGAPSPVPHPPTPVSAANFRPDRPAFDAAAHAGALARRAHSSRPRPLARRRNAARTRPVGSLPTQVTIGQLSRFLANPAKVFLQSAAGIGIYRGAELNDDVPLVAGGLERWEVRSELLEAWQAGTTGETVENAIRLRETFPPLEMGRQAFADARSDAWSLWEQARDDWAGELAGIPVSVPVTVPGLGTVTVADEIRTHGGIALTITASSGDEKLITPWVETLVLAAAGHAVPARLHRLIKWYGDSRPEKKDFAPVAPEEARAHLATVVRAYALGQHRLLGVPASPAIKLASEHRRGSFDRAEWAGDTSDYRSKWPWPDESWLVFYRPDVADLLEDPPLPEDPATGQESSFECWALALYGPLIESSA